MSPLAFARFIGFAVVRAWQGFWRNAMMSLAATATVILMLVLLSGLFISLAGLNSGLEFIESKVGVTAKLVDGLPGSQRDVLVRYAEGLPGVASVEYVSPDEAMDRLREAWRERGQTLDLGGADIDLYASIEITLVDADESAGVSAALAERSEVAQITTKQAEYDKLLDIIGVFRTIGVVALVLVGGGRLRPGSDRAVRGVPDAHRGEHPVPRHPVRGRARRRAGGQRARQLDQRPLQPLGGDLRPAAAGPRGPARVSET
jgi:cell division protein FtsX